MKPAQPTLFRTLTVMVTLLAWLAISNHCALAALQPRETKEVCSSCHHDDQKAQSQKAPEGEIACCKVLKAVETKALWQPMIVPTGTLDAVIFASELCLLPHLAVVTIMPTGPPPAVASTALIFQRCHRVNAPPFLA